MNFKILILAGVLLSVFLGEKISPQIIDRRVTWRHDRTNLGMGLFNNLMLTYAFLKVNFTCTDILYKNSIGILNALELNGVLRGAISFFILDMSIYVWHVFLHKSNFLYRFHAVHHTDRDMNVTTAFRFHFVELIMGFVFRLIAIGVFGILFKEVILYEIFLNINVYIHHSNLKISPKLDDKISKFIVSPYTHRVHHSVIFNESNSNYGSVFIFWDKLFRTYTDPAGNSTSAFGDINFKSKKYQNFLYMLVQPFKHIEVSHRE